MLSVVVANCLGEHMAKCLPLTILIAAKPMKGMTGMGPECVKTLSYLACFSPLLLGVAISRLFTTISAGNASERV